MGTSNVQVSAQLSGLTPGTTYDYKLVATNAGGTSSGIVKSFTTRAGGFPDRTAVAARYAAATGYDVSDLAWYQAFSAWRMAIIAEGIKHRYESRTMSSDEVDMGHLDRRVLDLAAQADQFLQEAGS